MFVLALVSSGPRLCLWSLPLSFGPCLCLLVFVFCLLALLSYGPCLYLGRCFCLLVLTPCPSLGACLVLVLFFV